MAPPLPVEKVGRVDAVFVSHAHHFDNLDNAEKGWLPKWGKVLTRPDAAKLLEGSNVNAEGLATWESPELTNELGDKVKVTLMPAVHTNNEEAKEKIEMSYGG